MAGAYDKLDSVRVGANFKNNSGVLTDPTTIVLKVKTPDNVITTYTYGSDAEIIKSSTGKFYADLDISQIGIHFYRWEGSGSLQAAGESKFTIKASEF